MIDECACVEVEVVASPLTRIKEQAMYLLKGPGSNTPSRALVSVPPPQPPLRTSLVFESHIQEAGKASSRNPQTVSSAWDERGRWGEAFTQVWQGLTAQDRKAIMLDLYLNIPASSSCVEVISKRIFSGGFTVEKIDEEGPDNKEHYDQLMEFCLRVNDDWDFCQLGRSLVQDLLIYGECYSEILFQSGLPYQLVKVDCQPMGFRANKWGQIEQFYQVSSATNQKNWLKPDNIIRWWIPHPKASIDPFAPIEKVTDPALIDKKMMLWMISFFQKGGKFPYYFKGLADQDEADRFMTWARQNFLGEKNAHMPPTTWGNAEIVPLGNQGALQMDFGKDQDRMEIKIYGAYGVPPASVSIIQTGAMGGHSEQEQDKMLIFNGCDPVKQLIFEKMNYRIVKKGFNIHDYRIGAKYADYRSDKDLAETEDKRIRNGSRTINEIRMESGKRPYRVGGDVAIIATSKEITPLPRLDDFEEEQRQNAAVALQAAQAQADLAATKAKQAKEPPVPPAVPSNNQQQNVTQNATDQLEKKQQKQESQSNTGAMIALMIPPEIGRQIAVAGGEPVEDLHITLAFLGEASDLSQNVLVDMQQSLNAFAASWMPLAGRIAGLGRFDAPDGQEAPVIALPDIPGLPEFRQALLALLFERGCPAIQNHGYTPHITLAYIDASAPMPVEDVPHLNLYFDAICLVVGDERFYFPLLGQKTESQEEPLNGQPAPDAMALHDDPRYGIWVGDDVQQRLLQLKEQGVTHILWKVSDMACDICRQNDMQQIPLGERFNTGHQLPPVHPHCYCETVYLHGEQEGDREATQKLPVIKKLTDSDLWEGRA